MNCTDIDQHINGFLDGRLSTLREQAFAQHISRCTACEKKVDAERQLRSMLRAIPVQSPSNHFRQRVLTRVRQEYVPKRQNHFQMKMAAGFASVAVFSLTLWFMSGMQATGPDNKPDRVVALASNESQSLRIMFEADTDIKQAELSIDLPDNVLLVGYPARKSLSWKTDLQKGENVLALPVQVSNEGRGELRTRLIYHNKVKSYSFVIDAQGKALANKTHNF
jgi:anti-sigma factor (TIGR02949 family)